MKSSFLFLKPLMIVALVSLGILTTSCEVEKKADAVEKIPFSHATHIKKYNIKDCGTCHKYDEKKAFRGMPSIGD
jgi:hypothetical protein